MSIHVFNATLTKQLQAAFLHLGFVCTVQFTCTVRANSAIHLHCSGDFFFFFSVYSFCIFFFLKKLILHSHVNNIFFSKKLV